MNKEGDAERTSRTFVETAKPETGAEGRVGFSSRTPVQNPPVRGWSVAQW